MFSRFLAFIFTLVFFQAQTQNVHKFDQLYDLLPTPNSYRTASGAPGPDYWQQRADYKIEVTLDEVNQTISGEETITYYNNSPDKLTYLWLQLDQNIRGTDSDWYRINQKTMSPQMSFKDFKDIEPWFDGGFKIESIKDTRGIDLPYTINKTMMRIDLPQPLVSKGVYNFKIKWHYNLNNRDEVGGRSGYEWFEDEENALYTIAQFYPRMAVYNDVEGWQNKQFLGDGEFALNFGNFDVKITVPADHVVAATGEIQNKKEVLTPTQINRLNEAKTAAKPVLIITEEEARENEKSKSDKTKTWHFKAENVRDFAWASSRKFIWDAKGIQFGDRTVLAMSFYPKEANPLWGKYATEANLQTLETFSRHTFDYPYPVSISVNAKSIGMEYPMINFNYGRSEADGTYSEQSKYGVISVIIHEVGHNFFPMVVNSDERQWTWLDEGLNTFLQYLTEQDFEPGYPSRRGEPRKIVDYMKGDKTNMAPIMTNSESLKQFGHEGYGKPTTALNILRETIMGRELFDFAFKTYAQRWMFKHPTPADFFRTMEDASAVDLDWFWRGWFYTTDHVDIAITDVKWYRMIKPNAEGMKTLIQEDRQKEVQSITDIRNAEENHRARTQRDTTLVDFYTTYDPMEIDDFEAARLNTRYELLSDEEREVMNDDRNYYEIEFSLIGGLVMPIIVEFTFKDGSKEIKHIPAEIWRKEDNLVSKVFVTHKEVELITLDPYQQTADIDLTNNKWVVHGLPERFFLQNPPVRRPSSNPMQRARSTN